MHESWRIFVKKNWDETSVIEELALNVLMWNCAEIHWEMGGRAFVCGFQGHLKV